MKKLLILAALVAAVAETSCAQRRPMPPRPMRKPAGTQVQATTRPALKRPVRTTATRKPVRGRNVRTRAGKQAQPVKSVQRKPMPARVR